MSEPAGGADGRQAADARILREAAEWFAVLGSGGSPEEHLAFERWLEADPAHAAAWRRVDELSRRVGAARLDGRAALSALDTLRRRRRAIKVVAAAGLGALPAWLLVRNAPWLQPADYATAIGEQRKVQLPDGTGVWLNTDSALRLEFDGAVRRVRLLRGEALVETAPDPQSPARPFEVAADEGFVRPLGTRFDIYRDGTACRVAVYEGQVELQTLEGAKELLGAGLQSRFDARRIEAQAPAETARQAWTRGILVADNLRLGDLIAELARYRSGYLGCDAGVADLRVVGTFPLADTEQIFLALERSLPVRVYRPLAWYVSVEAR